MDKHPAFLLGVILVVIVGIIAALGMHIGPFL